MMHLRAALLTAVAWTGIVATVFVFALFSTPARHAGAAAPCTVPSASYLAIQDAVSDPLCDQIMLAAPAYQENVVITRSLSLDGLGPSATVVDGAATDSVFHIGSGLYVTLTGLTIRNGYAPLGGGIYNGGSQLLISDTVLVTNAVAPLGSGGGIYNQSGGQLTVRQSVLSANDGGQKGGAIFSAGALLLLDSAIVSNTAQDAGGLRLAPGGRGHVGNAVFASNRATATLGRGGAILAASPLTVTGTLFDGNQAGGRGGALFLNTAHLSGEANTFSANDAAEGGAIYAAASLLVDAHSQLSGNDATGNGGALAAVNSTVRLSFTRLEGNEASSGGALFLDGGALTIDATSLDGNVAAYHGGGVYATGALSVTASTLSHNGALLSGGAVWVAAPLLLRNSTVSHNSAVSGAGLLTFASLVVESSTIAYNTASAGGGIGGSGNVVTLHNTILAANSGGDCIRVSGAAIISQGYNMDGDGTCLLVNTGDQSRVDPLLLPLADNGGPTTTHALSPQSSAVDAGASGACPAVDQRGVIRPLDGNGGVAICDIGALEYDGPPAYTAAVPLIRLP